MHLCAYTLIFSTLPQDIVREFRPSGSEFPNPVKNFFGFRKFLNRCPKWKWRSRSPCLKCLSKVVPGSKATREQCERQNNVPFRANLESKEGIVKSETFIKAHQVDLHLPASGHPELCFPSRLAHNSKGQDRRRSGLAGPEPENGFPYFVRLLVLYYIFYRKLLSSCTLKIWIPPSWWVKLQMDIDQFVRIIDNKKLKFCSGFMEKSIAWKKSRNSPIHFGACYRYPQIMNEHLVFPLSISSNVNGTVNLWQNIIMCVNVRYILCALIFILVAFDSREPLNFVSMQSTQCHVFLPLQCYLPVLVCFSLIMFLYKT